MVDFPQLLTASLANPELKKIHIERLPSLHQVNATGGACEVTLATLPQLAAVHIELADGDVHFDDLPALQSVQLSSRVPRPLMNGEILCEQLAGLPRSLPSSWSGWA